MTLLLLFGLFALLIVLEVPVAFAMGLASIVDHHVHAADPAVDRRAAHGHRARQLRADRHPAVRAGRPPAQPRRHRRPHLRVRRRAGRATSAAASRMSTSSASMIFAGMSGVAQADAAGLGVVEVNAMRKEGFDPAFAAAVQRRLGDHRADHSAVGDHGRLRGAGAGVGGRPVPRRLPARHPDGLRADGDDLLARAHRRGSSRRRPRAMSCPRLGRTFVRALPALAAPILLAVGLLAGVATPTELGALTVVYAAGLGFAQRELTVRDVIERARAKRWSPAACWSSSSPAPCRSAGSSPPRRRR